MSYPFIHLALNHFPVIGIAVVIILLGVALFYNNNFVAKVSLWLLVLFALMTVGVYWTGMNSVAVVSPYPNVAPEFIAQHIQMANRACTLMGILGGLAFLGLLVFLRQKEVPRYFSLIVLITTIVGSVFFARTNEIGSLIAHPELRTNEVQALSVPEVQPFSAVDSQNHISMTFNPIINPQSGGEK